jgi:DUF1365 family protein
VIKSALYVGDVEHRRMKPLKHEFRYSVCYYFLNCEEVGKIFRYPFLMSYNFPGVLSFWDKDYLDSDKVRALIRLKTGVEHSGPIMLLTNVSYFGLCFNPVSFYYCYEEDGQSLRFIVSEITNTPWGEKHQQVFSFNGPLKEKYDFPKEFHISPFMPMNIDYNWTFERPENGLRVFMQNRLGGEVIFDSTLKLKKVELSLLNAFFYFLKFPLITIKTLLAIYWEAARLYLKQVPFHSHPKKEQSP